MIYLEVKINGLFAFKDFSENFVYSRKAKNDEMFQHLENYPNLKYKKLNILMGANSSGKSTLGKMLCMISNYVLGRDISSTLNIDLSLMCKKNALFNDNIYFETTFYHDKYVYRLYVSLDEQGITKESWKKIKLAKNDTYQIIVNKLNNVDEQSIYIRDNNELHFGFKSPELSKVNSKFNLIKNISYSYNFQQFEFTRKVDDTIRESKEFRNHLLKIFDPSIASIDEITSVVTNEDGTQEEVNLNMERVRFVNGRVQDINFNKELTSENTSLSTGTIEAIHLAHILFKIKRFQILYLDEIMVHSHHELEPCVLQYIMKVLEKNEIQVFFTTHSVEALELDIPNYNYMFMRKSEDGYISKAVHPSDTRKHNKRTLAHAYINDQFSTSPDTTNFIDLILEYDDE